MKPTSNRALMLLAALACVPLACKDGGCGGASNGGAPAAQTSAAPGASAIASTSAGPRRGPPIRVGGATGALYRAALGLELKPETKAAVEKLAAGLREPERGGDPDAGPRASMKAARDELLAGVKLGKLDAAKMDGLLASLEPMAAARQEREAAALDGLHAALPPAERAAVVAAARAAETKRAERARAREEADGGVRDAGARGFGTRARFENLVRDLGLEPDQEKKVQALLPKDDPKTDLREEMKRRAEAVYEAFPKDDFSAKSLAVEPKKALQPMADTVRFLGQLVPLLTPIQRDKLAAKVDRMPLGGGEGRRPGRGEDDEEAGGE